MRKLFFALIALLILAACGDSEDKAPVLQGVAQPPTPTPDAAAPASPFSGLPEPILGQWTLPQVAGVEGRLIFYQGGSLYAARFDGQPPVVLAEDAAPSPVELAPGGDRLAAAVESEWVGFNTRERRYSLALIDLASAERSVVTDLYIGNRAGVGSMFPGWSPDGRALLIWQRGDQGLTLLYVPADAPTGTLDLVGFPAAAWLDDGTLLYVGLRPEATGGPSPDSLGVLRYDPATQARTLVQPISDPAEADFVALEAALNEQGYAFAPTYHDYHRAARLPDGTRVYIDWPLDVRNFRAELCSTWEIRRAPGAGESEPPVLYSAPETTFLTDLSVLPDGSLLFLEWALEGCQFTGALHVRLLRLVPGAAPDVLAEGIDPGTDANPNGIPTLGVLHGQKYAVSPDGRYVFWAGGGMAAGIASLNVTDREAGLTVELLRAGLSASGEGSFEDVLWVPG